jgi:hypothetical protein
MARRGSARGLLRVLLLAAAAVLAVTADQAEPGGAAPAAEGALAAAGEGDAGESPGWALEAQGPTG